MSVAVILGSAFDDRVLSGELGLEPREVRTAFGPVTLHRFTELSQRDGKAWVSFRHGLPHRLLPHQIPYRAQAAALGEVGCEALLVTSSVGLLDPALPLDAPMLVSDLILLDARLPDGGACTMFPEPVEGQGHLVLDEGLISAGLSDQVAALVIERGWPKPPRVVFAYTGGPRTKTPAENAAWARLGAQVDSMTLGPEVVLANELEIPTAALVVGHKYSLAERRGRVDPAGTARSLQLSREVMLGLVRDFLARAEPVAFGNSIYRF